MWLREAARGLALNSYQTMRFIILPQAMRVIIPPTGNQFIAMLKDSSLQDVTETPCAIDSPDPRAVEAALSVHQGIPMINSISLEKERYDNLMPVVAGTDMKVIALCMSDEGMPQTVDDRLKIAEKLVNGLVQNNVSVENIFVDPLVKPLSVNDLFGLEFLNAKELIMKRFEGVHPACGLSNISYGLPARKFMNQTFMAMAIVKGLDGAIDLVLCVSATRQ